MEHWLDFLLPETASAPVRARTRYTIAGALAGLIEVCSILLFHFGAAPDLVLLGAVVGLVWLAWEFVLLVRSLDELQQRIHLTALACAGGGTAFVLTNWAIAGLVLPLPELNSVVALPMFVVLYWVVLSFQSRRYA
ncbi:hypothetical protein [Oceanicaulis sp. UBA2681]|jgi:hypothetical protein|uniref:hypothetical protein n=1 Tax=Oceanicaulis sp. UBA2681 TaxID=1947007 RepID=UPI000EE3EA15|nr:hypothetical protein [Oceanicaulis sp. UBA2681]HCR67399.1 hypothetical protein [Oceanicaulis sp.]|tara:strand:- start:1128 stop:1535 length:408 start_codon:yes stop_codon:yes gene_type:complete